MSNQVTVPPWYDIFQMLKKDIFAGLRVCLPGSVSAVNTADGTVDVRVGVMQNVAQQGLVGGLNFKYPQLLACPVVTVQGGGVGAVMPISVGDECLVVFSDRCIDNWIQNGEATPLPNFRMHDIGDGFVLVGLNSFSNALLTPLGNDEGGICETQNAAGAKIVVNSATSLVSIQNGSQNLYTTLSDLVTAVNDLIAVLNTLTTTGGPTTQTISAATVAALAVVTTELTAVQLELDGLLY